MLLAAASLLSSSGFSYVEDEAELAKTDPTSFEGKLAAIAVGKRSIDTQQKSSEQINIDRLYLLIGICRKYSLISFYSIIIHLT